MTEGSKAGLGVSVIVPAYNAAGFLSRCLASLDAQDLDADQFEVVAVDDGSTDGTGELLDRYAEDHRYLRVLHLESSGWPGRPRNVGTDAARGEFVFYLDADDALSPQALRRMLAFAREHSSDAVVVGRVTVQGGCVISSGHRRAPVADAPLSALFESLTAHKLIRRKLLVEHGIRFPEGRVTFEDGIFLARLAPHARRISALEDAEYYIKHRRPGPDGNISRQRWGHARARAQSVGRIIATLHENGADPGETEVISFRLYARVLHSWDSKRFLRLSTDQQNALVATMHELIVTYMPVSFEAALARRLRWRSRAFRTGRRRVVVALAQFEKGRIGRAGLLPPPALVPTLLRAALASPWARRPQYTAP